MFSSTIHTEVYATTILLAFSFFFFMFQHTGPTKQIYPTRCW